MREYAKQGVFTRKLDGASKEFYSQKGSLVVYFNFASNSSIMALGF